MRRRIVNLNLEGSNTIPVEAWDTDVPGLIVTPAVTTHRVIDGQYNVTHEKSGGRVGSNLWDSVEVALLYAERVRNLNDWTLDTEALKEAFAPDAPQIAVKLGEQLQAEVNANPKMVLRRINA